MVFRVSGDLGEESCQVLGEVVCRCSDVVNYRPQRDSLFMYLRQAIQSWGPGAGRT